MKRLLLTIVTSLLLTFGAASAQSPIYLEHTLSSYSHGADTVTLEFSLNVENTGDTPLYNITLSNVPLMIFSAEDVSLNIGDLGPQESVGLSFSLTTPMLFLSEEKFLRYPLFWAGEGMDGSGNFIEFPATSHTIERGVQ